MPILITLSCDNWVDGTVPRTVTTCHTFTECVIGLALLICGFGSVENISIANLDPGNSSKVFYLQAIVPRLAAAHFIRASPSQIFDRYDSLPRIKSYAELTLLPGQLFHAIKAEPGHEVETLRTLFSEGFLPPYLGGYQMWPKYALSFHVAGIRELPAGLQPSVFGFSLWAGTHPMGVILRPELSDMFSANGLIAEDRFSLVVNGASISPDGDLLNINLGEAYRLLRDTRIDLRLLVKRIRNAYRDYNGNASPKRFYRRDIIPEVFRTLFVAKVYQHFRHTGNLNYFGLIPILGEDVGQEFIDLIVHREIGIQGYVIDPVRRIVDAFVLTSDCVQALVLSHQLAPLWPEILAVIPEKFHDRIEIIDTSAPMNSQSVSACA